MNEKEVSLRCHMCHDFRFNVKVFQTIAPKCPKCGTEWRLKWFDEDTPLIVGVKSWKEWEQKIMKEMAEGEENG